MSADWIEPQEDWLPDWPPGTIALDKRTGLLLVLGDHTSDFVSLGWSDCDCARCDGATYYSFRVQHLDGTDLTDGHFRPPDDLEPLTPLEVLAYAARNSCSVASQ